MKNLKYILAVIGLGIPLLSLIDNDLLGVTVVTNPLAVFFGYFATEYFNLNDLNSILAIAAIGGLIYFLIGIVISELLVTKKGKNKEAGIHKKSSLVFLVFLVIMFVFAALFLNMLRGAFV